MVYRYLRENLEDTSISERYSLQGVYCSVCYLNMMFEKQELPLVVKNEMAVRLERCGIKWRCVKSDVE
jgi:hypothetical protein